MIKGQTKPMSFEEFMEWYPEDGKDYELHEGVIDEIMRTGHHEDVRGFLIAELNLEIHKRELNYSIPRNCTIEPLGFGSGYKPDVVVLDRELIKEEPMWSKASVIQNGTTIPLIVEVVGPNLGDEYWGDEYGHKFMDYEDMGIAEYWIVDYLALGAVGDIGKPKQQLIKPTITVCQLMKGKYGKYQKQQFIAGQRLSSQIFPELDLTTDRIFQAAGL